MHTPPQLVDWRPVSESPPRKGSYLTFTTSLEYDVAHWDGDNWYTSGGQDVAHWTYLPLPPQVVAC